MSEEMDYTIGQRARVKRDARCRDTGRLCSHAGETCAIIGSVDDAEEGRILWGVGYFTDGSCNGCCFTADALAPEEDAHA